MHGDAVVDHAQPPQTDQVEHPACVSTEPHLQGHIGLSASDGYINESSDTRRSEKGDLRTIEHDRSHISLEFGSYDLAQLLGRQEVEQAGTTDVRLLEVGRYIYRVVDTLVGPFGRRES